ncbi:MAG TPA: hypothetical protein VHZ50_17850, partial [Puia sp.]|nr:hypothetical protein [Puia sp.]
MPGSEQPAELSKIIKRLELIKTLISLEEEKEISGHIIKLRQFSLNEELEDIIVLLEQKSYSQVMPAIETFINQHHQLTFYNDPEIEGLKLETKSLENEINILSDEKADLEKFIHEFGVRHNEELGKLILKILSYRKEKAKGTPQEKETEKDYADYSNEY